VNLLIVQRLLTCNRTLIIRARPFNTYIIMSKPHSKTVRGTFDNPKTKAAIESGSNPPRLGDHVSLKPENDDPPTPENQKSKSVSSLVPTTMTFLTLRK
jgi:hypothetical protein